MHIEIIDEPGHPLNETKRSLYRFYVRIQGDRIISELDVFVMQSRPSKRHKWKNDAVYNRIFKRESSLRREEILIPNHVSFKLRLEIVQRIDLAV